MACNVCHHNAAPVHHLVELESTSARQVWFAVDATACGQLQCFKDWLNELEETASDFGYYANATKSWLIVKGEYYKQAVNVFGNGGVKITKDGQRHLGAS